LYFLLSKCKLIFTPTVVFVSADAGLFFAVVLLSPFPFSCEFGDKGADEALGVFSFTVESVEAEDKMGKGVLFAFKLDSVLAVDESIFTSVDGVTSFVWKMNYA